MIDHGLEYIREKYHSVALRRIKELKEDRAKLVLALEYFQLAYKADSDVYSVSDEIKKTLGDALHVQKAIKTEKGDL